jgi:hypothetical protein
MWPVYMANVSLASLFHLANAPLALAVLQQVLPKVSLARGLELSF